MEVLLLSCLQANFIIGRIKLHPKLNNEQKVELIREIRTITKSSCAIY